MGKKNLLQSYQLITNGNMTGTSTITSSTQTIATYDNIGLQISWTGTPTGTISILCSIDGKNFSSLTFNPTLTQPAGSSGSYLIDLNQIPFPYLQVQYVNASGSGTLNVFICQKDLN